jgi:hypothetical protein
VKAGSEKLGSSLRQKHYWLYTGPLFALIGGCREIGIFRQGMRSHKHRSHPFSSHRFILYNFTEITITTPPLTRILDRLIGGGISLYSDVV